jgi:hypothetical protein
MSAWDVSVLLPGHVLPQASQSVRVVPVGLPVPSRDRVEPFEHGGIDGCVGVGGQLSCHPASERSSQAVLAARIDVLGRVGRTQTVESGIEALHGQRFERSQRPLGGRVR